MDIWFKTVNDNIIDYYEIDLVIWLSQTQFAIDGNLCMIVAVSVYDSHWCHQLIK